MSYLEAPIWGKYYIWQTHMYGSGKVDDEAPAEIWFYRPMPCTPSGDFICKVKTGQEAIEVVSCLNKKEG